MKAATPVPHDAIPPETAQEVLAGLSGTVIYVFGTGMIIGSLITILALMLLDYTRRNKAQ